MRVSGRTKALVLAVLGGIGLLNAIGKWEPNLGHKSAAASPESAPIDRAKTMALLFEEFCIGALHNMPHDPRSQLERSVIAGVPAWVDTPARLSLFISQVPPKTCVLTDNLQHLTAAEQAELAQIVAQKMPQWAPELVRRDPPDQAEAVQHAWVHDGLGSWGITLKQKAQAGQDAATLLTLKAPAN